MARFKIGDIAVGVRPLWSRDPFGHHNAEVTIASALRMRRFDRPFGTIELGYIVVVDGVQYLARPVELRPKHEPAHWDDCVWQPETETADRTGEP